MKFLQILVFVILISGVGLSVEAQICGPSKTKIYVRDTAGNIVKNAKLEFPKLPKDADYFKDEWLKFEDNAYVIYFRDSKPHDYNLLKISAQGFETSQQSIRITEAQYQVFNLTLKRAGTNEVSSFEELISIFGEVKDANDARISKAKVIFTDKKGKKTEALTTDDGGYNIEALPGRYDVEIVGTEGFVSAKYQNFEVSKNQQRLDAVLETGSNDKFLATELICRPHEYLANKFDCALTAKNQSGVKQK